MIASIQRFCRSPAKANASRPTRRSTLLATSPRHFADVSGDLTEKINTELNSALGLRHNKCVQLYQGHEDLDSFDDYALRFTYLVDDVKFRDGKYTLVTSDIQRTTKTDIILDLHRGVFTSRHHPTPAGAIPVVTVASSASREVPTPRRGSHHASTAVGYYIRDPMDEIISRA